MEGGSLQYPREGSANLRHLMQINSGVMTGRSCRSKAAPGRLIWRWRPPERRPPSAASPQEQRALDLADLFFQGSSVVIDMK